MRILWVLAICAAALFAQAPAGKQAKGKAAEKAAPVPEWRRSAEKYDSEVREYYWAEAKKEKGEFPGPSFNYLKTGGEVPMTTAAMRTYSGLIQWEGTFNGTDLEGDHLASRPKKLKIDLAKLVTHVYPAQNAVEAWSKVVPGSKVRFQGIIEGLAAWVVLGGMAPVVSIKDAVPLP